LSTVGDAGCKSPCDERRELLRRRGSEEGKRFCAPGETERGLAGGVLSSRLRRWAYNPTIDFQGEFYMAVAEETLKAMQETNERFCREVIAEGDFGAIDRVYTASARILPPGAPMAEGRPAIAAFWKGAVSSLGVTGAKLSTLDVEMAGDTAVETGLAELELGQQVVLAKYIVHWKQEEGTWLWDKDIWNMN
jgi:ketosteroid isomerase-like protein